MSRCSLCFALLVCGTLTLAGCGGNKPSVTIETPSVNQLTAKENEPTKKAEVVENKAATAPEEGKTEFRFADDQSGKELATLLPPASPPALDPRANLTPWERSLPEYIANPGAITPGTSIMPPNLPLGKSSPVRPRPLPDRVPADLGGTTLVVPSRIDLPEGSLTKVESIDIDEPAPLPILARPIGDRAPLEDPTTDYTNKSVIAEVLPIRDAVASFVKFTLPDPFEFAETIRLRQEIKVAPESLPIPQSVPRAPDFK